MGTRGLFGFKYKGNYYLIYNHFDSYPSGLGANLIGEIKFMIDNNLFNIWIRLLENIQIVDKSIAPTDEDILKLSVYADLNVSECSEKDWYCLLRKCQGSFKRVLESGYLLDSGFDDKVLLHGDIFIEYTYILNFDDNTFEVGPGKTQIYTFDKLPKWRDNNIGMPEGAEKCFL